MPYNIVLIGTGRIAKEYIKALDFLNLNYLIIGNTERSVNQFNKETDKKAIPGGISKSLSLINSKSYVINTVQVEKLQIINNIILNKRPASLLVEKPGFVSWESAISNKEKYKSRNNLHIATNRRFFNSVIHLKKILKVEKPISCHFEFNERLFNLDPASWNDEVLFNWSLANSVHVIDTAFHLIGQPKSIKTQKRNLSYKWTNYDQIIGFGESELDVLFTFNSNWITKGSWKIEIKTKNHSYQLNPMEELYRDGNIIVHSTNKGVKEGFIKMIENWLSQKDKLPTVDQFIDNLIKQKPLYN